MSPQNPSRGLVFGQKDFNDFLAGKCRYLRNLQEQIHFPKIPDFATVLVDIEHKKLKGDIITLLLQNICTDIFPLGAISGVMQ